MPPEGSFIAANHQGYMDILVMASLTPQVFLSKHVGAVCLKRCAGQNRSAFFRRADGPDPLEFLIHDWDQTHWQVTAKPRLRPGRRAPTGTRQPIPLFKQAKV